MSSFYFVKEWSRRGQRRLLGLVISLVVGFTVLSVIISLIPAGTLDIALSEGAQRYDHPIFDKLMKFTSWFGYGWQTALTLFATAGLFLWRKRKREAWFTLASALCLIPVFALKFAFGRERPAVAIFDLVTSTPYQSFPSGHVALYVTFFGFLIFLMHRLRELRQGVRTVVTVFCALMIFLVPFSRVYLGAHWFTDVMGGFIVGVLCLIVLCLFYLRAIHKPGRPKRMRPTQR